MSDCCTLIASVFEIQTAKPFAVLEMTFKGYSRSSVVRSPRLMQIFIHQ